MVCETMISFSYNKPPDIASDGLCDFGYSHSTVAGGLLVMS